MFEPATDAGVNKQRQTTKKSRPVVAASDATVIARMQDQSAMPREGPEPRISPFDAIRVAELIEACRARALA
jgi:hypothetical protein